MVQLFYYENRGKNCRKILNYQGRPSKIFLYPDESFVANGGKRSHWILKTTWWSANYCKIIEVVAGVRQRETRGHIYNHPTSGIMYIEGRFKDDREMPDFCMKLTSQIFRGRFSSGLLYDRYLCESKLTVIDAADFENIKQQKIKQIIPIQYTFSVHQNFIL